MNLATLLYTLLSVALTLFMVRWAINWTLLNRINGTRFPFVPGKYTLYALFQLSKHVAVSEWKFWWWGKGHTTLKVISNVLSFIIYTCFIMIIYLLSTWQG
ncbi:hypothetical protein SAMN05421823_112146 [Catalinimonas alkaloidigena]|uniref:Uncharacterized protein n=1 Tax=Catalinimonas alkaloidigena TaxID=1075417 RepID=A0A1G9SFG1_9BACT|nr:hypothetical protein [Catalinimonas alkaloidigena]SDM34213.1 hypothetical protein SAMN05421823_112146 [Catalinimonas alkaloidigena]